MDEAGSRILNDKLIEYRDKVDKRKHYITYKQTYRQLSELTNSYFKQIFNNEDNGEKDWLLFSRRSILNKLEVDMIQKRVVKDDKQYVNDGHYLDTNQQDEIGEKDTKQSLSEKP